MSEVTTTVKKSKRIPCPTLTLRMNDDLRTTIKFWAQEINATDTDIILGAMFCLNELISNNHDLEVYIVNKINELARQKKDKANTERRKRNQEKIAMGAVFGRPKQTNKPCKAEAEAS